MWNNFTMSFSNIFLFLSKFYFWQNKQNLLKTRMHSSGMCTARLFTVSQYALWWGGYLPRGCTCQRGCTCLRGVYLLLGVPAWGVYLLGGVPAQGSRRCTCLGVCVPAWGVPALAGVFLLRYSPLWTEWLTDRCKNITFANFVCER